MKRKVRIRSKVDAYKVVDRAISEGVTWGWNRAHKHSDQPSEETIKQQIHYHVMLTLSEVVNWDDPED